MASIRGSKGRWVGRGARLAAIAFFAVSAGVFAGPTAATTTVINFDSYAAGTQITAPINGVTFVASAEGNPSVFTPAHTTTSSPPNALHTAGTCSNGCTGSNAYHLRANIDHPVSSVSVNIGLDDQPSGELGVYAELYAYNSSDTLVGTSGEQSLGALDYYPITHTFTASSSAVDITHVLISVGQTDSYAGPRYRVNIDDFTFTDDPTSPPPAPIVSISSPAHGSLFPRISDIRVSGHVSAPAGVNRFCLTTSTDAAIPATCAQGSSLNGSGNFSNLLVSGLQPGTNQITAWIEDRMLRTSSAEVQVSIPPIDLRPTGIEVTQGIQGSTLGITPSGDAGPHSASYNGLPLARHHPTIVRVWVGGQSLYTGTLPEVRVTLSGIHDGASLGTIFPLQGTRNLAPSDLVPAPVSMANWSSSTAAYDFRVPNSWVDGAVQFSATVNPASASAITECSGCGANNTLTLTGTTFQPVQTEIINPVEMFTRSGGAVVEPPYNFYALVAMMPFDVRITPYIGQIDISDGVGVSSRETRQALAMDKLFSFDDHNGTCWVDNGHCLSGHTIAVSQGQDLGLTATRFVCCDTHIGIDTLAQTDTGRPITSMAHEYGHELGRSHAGRQPNDCGGDSDGQHGSDWPPDQAGQLEGVGVDTRVGSGRPGEGPLHVFAPTTNFDFMSYCGGSNENIHWISTVNWTQFFNDHRASASPEPRSTRPVAAAARRPAGLHVLAVIGQVTRILRVEPVHAPRIGHARRSGAHLVLRSASGRQVADVPVQLTNGHMDHLGVFRVVSAVVPSAGVGQIALKSNGAVVARVKRPRHVPRVKLLAPRKVRKIPGKGKTLVRWRVKDPDRVRKLTAIDYSPDNGRHWRPVAIGIPGSSYRLPNSLLTKSSRGRLRVRVSDGWNEGRAVSLRLRVAGPPAQAMIAEPMQGAVVQADAPLTLSGRAWDGAALPIGSRGLRWYVGGAYVGSGASVTATGLAPGRQEVRLVARAADGRRSSVKVSIVVRAVRPDFLRLSVPGSVALDAHSVSILVASTERAVLVAGGRRFDVSSRPRRVTVDLASGAREQVLRLKLEAGGKSQTAYRLVRRDARASR